MDWITLIRDGGGWVAAALVIGWVGHSFRTGEIVPGESYRKLNDMLDQTSELAERLAREQREDAAEERRRFLEEIELLRRHRPGRSGESP